ncbi:SDR family oxidoreductase [Streptomyces sp. NBUA17]
MSTSIVVGGSNGLGRLIAQRHADRGHTVVVTSRNEVRAKQVAAEIGSATSGLAVDLARPETIAASLASVAEVDHLVITATQQLPNTLENFDVANAIDAVTVKLVGYTETVRALRGRFTPKASVVLFGGLAKDRPYPGSTMVTSFNGGVSSLLNTLAVELAPHRVNAVHPGVVGDSPKWATMTETHPHIARTPIGRLVTMDEVAHAVDFLLTNNAVNAVNLSVDGGLTAN